MKKFAIAVCMFVLLLPTLVLAETDPKALLAQVDQRRYLADMAMDLELSSMDGSKILDRQELSIFTKLVQGQNNTLVWFGAPVEVQGRRMLMQGNAVYLLFPKTRNPVRLSPLQVLLGESSNGDIARTAFSLDYEAISLEEGSFQEKFALTLELKLLPNRQGASYPRISLSVDKDTLRILGASFADAAGTVSKIVRYGEYQVIDGKDMPLLLEIQDAKDSNKTTTLRYKNVRSLGLPESSFRKEYLANWVPPGVKK